MSGIKPNGILKEFYGKKPIADQANSDNAILTAIKNKRKKK